MNAYQWETGDPLGGSAAVFVARNDREAHGRAAHETGGGPYRLYRITIVSYRLDPLGEPVADGAAWMGVRCGYTSFGRWCHPDRGCAAERPDGERLEGVSVPVLGVWSKTMGTPLRSTLSRCSPSRGCADVEVWVEPTPSGFIEYRKPAGPDGRYDLRLDPVWEGVLDGSGVPLRYRFVEVETFELSLFVRYGECRGGR